MRSLWLPRWALLTCGLFFLSIGGAAASDVARVAVFDFELIDTSLEGEIYGTRPEEIERLKSISDLLRLKLSESQRYQLVDTSPAQERIADVGYIHGCNGCEAKIARSLGADQAITGTVQKVSNLILNINLFVRDANTSRLVQAFSVDVRGNTDESWSRGLSYLLRNRLLKDQSP